MAATITYASSRVTITGAYKQFTATTSTATVIQFASGEAPAAGDVGRMLLWCRGGTTETGPWQVRTITAADASSVTVHDAFGAVPTAGDTFRVSSNADDILAAQPSAGSKTGTSTYTFNGDLSLASTAFFAARNQAIEWTFAGADPSMPMADNCALQLGQIWGGEANNATEATDGCRWSLRQTGLIQSSIFSAANTRSASGPLFSVYGTLVESSVAGGYLFHRMRGPARFIGSVFDGVAGGRFYHEASEWYGCNHSGNDNLIPAWSLGASFTRNIDRVRFYRNLAAFKTYVNFSSTLRNCEFSDSNTDIVRVESTSGGVTDFIDCTEFLDDKISDNGAGTLQQYRSVNLTTTDASGAALSGVNVRINNVADAIQGSVQTSDGSGVVAEILALRRRWHYASPSSAFHPFRIRLRKFGYLSLSLGAAIADPIKQSVALTADAFVTGNKATADALSGFTFNSGTKTLTLTASRTVQEVYNRCVSYLSDNLDVMEFATFDGGTLDLADWNVVVSGSGVVLSGDAGQRVETTGTISTNSGGEIGAALVYEDATGVHAPIIVGGVRIGTHVRVIRTDTSTEVAIGLAGADGYTTRVTWTTDIPLRADTAYVNGLDAEQEASALGTLTANGAQLTIVQQPCAIYEGNAIDGSTVTGLTLDAPNVEIDADEVDNYMTVQEIYAWYKVTLMTEAGIRTLFGAITPVNAHKYRVNASVVPLKIDQKDLVNSMVLAGGQIYRDDGEPLRLAGSGVIEFDVGDVYESQAAETALSAIKAKTDSLTFTVAGQVDANVQYVNDVQVTGDGQTGTEWGPA